MSELTAQQDALLESLPIGSEVENGSSELRVRLRKVSGGRPGTNSEWAVVTPGGDLWYPYGGGAYEAKGFPTYAIHAHGLTIAKVAE